MKWARHSPLRFTDGDRLTKGPGSTRSRQVGGTFGERLIRRISPQPQGHRIINHFGPLSPVTKARVAPLAAAVEPADWESTWTTRS